MTFLNLPFYERGRYRRFRSGDDDAAAVQALISGYRPHQIYVTGDAADPSSVAAIGYKLVEAALKNLESEEWFGLCSLWCYRGKEKAFETHEIDMAVPLSPVQLERKVHALTRYGSLTSQEHAAADVNRESARHYDALGMAEYEAMECFQRWQRK